MSSETRLFWVVLVAEVGRVSDARRHAGGQHARLPGGACRTGTCGRCRSASARRRASSSAVLRRRTCLVRRLRRRVIAVVLAEVEGPGAVRARWQAVAAADAPLRSRSRRRRRGACRSHPPGRPAHRAVRRTACTAVAGSGGARSDTRRSPRRSRAGRRLRAEDGFRRLAGDRAGGAADALLLVDHHDPAALLDRLRHRALEVLLHAQQVVLLRECRGKGREAKWWPDCGALRCLRRAWIGERNCHEVAGPPIPRAVRSFRRLSTRSGRRRLRRRFLRSHGVTSSARTTVTTCVSRHDCRCARSRRC